MPIKAIIDDFLHYLSYQKRYSEHTVIAYRNDLYSFSDFLEHTFEMDALTEVARRHISTFIAELSESGLKPRSINRKLSSIQSLFEYATRQGITKKNPARNIQRPKTPSHLPNVVRNEAIEELFGHFEFPDDFSGVRDRLMLMLFYACGLRREELINLHLGSVQHSELQLRVIGKRNKERIVPIDRSLVDWINDYEAERSKLAPDHNFLFVTEKGKKLYPSLVYKIVKNYLSKVTTMDKKSPHVLRHTFATHLLNEGANLQAIKELLGHSSLAATQVYTHTSLDKLKDVYRNAHPRNKKT